MSAKRFALVTALAVPLTLAGCAATQSGTTDGPGRSTAPADLGALTGGEWRLASLLAGGKEVAVSSEALPTLTVEETGKVHGLATLNRYFGQMELRPGGEVRWAGPLGSTMMAGPEHLMDQEVHFLQALQAATKASLRDGALVLGDEGGQNVLEFRR